MTHYDGSSYMDGLADRLEICRLTDSAWIQLRSCCLSKDAKESARIRHKAWKEGE